MKKIFTLTILFALLVSAIGCNKKTETQKLPDAPNYSSADSWAKLSNTGTKEIDTFFVFPTLSLTSEIGGDFATINQMKTPAQSTLAQLASVFYDETNVYAPYYRQVAFSKAEKMNKDQIAYANFVKENCTYKDVVTALDYYFDNYNNGKPFILAGHSQGSCICYLLLEDYFKNHPDYLARMVAAYPIGWARDQAYYTKNTHLKFADGETDAGVIISWNTMGPDAKEDTIVLPKNAVVINPINWKKDDTYASKAENKGSLVNGEIVMNYADAKINLERGYVESDTEATYIVNDLVLGDKSLHGVDYQLFYNNIKENVAKRIETYLKK